MISIIASVLVFATALNCDVDKFRLLAIPSGAQTNGTLQAKDVPGATIYASASKRFTGGVCAASYGLREAQVMRKIIPLATGDIAGWGALQEAMPDLAAFDLCPTNYADETYSEKPEYRYFVTPKGTRCLSWADAEFGSIWNGIAKTGAYDLMTPPQSNRVFRTPRITSYLKAVIDMPINALRHGLWRKMGIHDEDSGGCWLDPAYDHASFVTGAWCEDDSSKMITDYAKFLKSLAEYRNDVDATQSVTRASTAFGDERVWEDFCTGSIADSVMEQCGYPRAKDSFESALGERARGKITDMIGKAAPGLRASITSDWQKAVQKMTASETTRLWWQRQALANGIVALQSKMFMPLRCFSYATPTADISGYLPSSRMNEIQGKEHLVSGDMAKTEYYEIPTDAISISYRRTDENPLKMHYAFVDASALAVTNTVATNNWHEEEADLRGSETHVAYWEHTGNAFGVGLYAERLISPDDFESCLPQAETAVVEFPGVEPGGEARVELDNFELRKEVVEDLEAPGKTKAVYNIYTRSDLPPPYANVFIQQLYVPGDGWTGYGIASLTATGEGRAYWTSDSPATWKPLTESVISGQATQNPIALVTEGSRLADMVKADMLLYEDAMAGTNCYSASKIFKDGEGGKKNAWIYSRLSAPYKDVVPTIDAMKDISQYANGAFPCRSRMGDVVAKLPDSDAGDPFNWSEMKAEAMNLVKDVKEVFPVTRGLPSETAGVIPWNTDERGGYGAFYLLTRDESGAYSAKWAAWGPTPGLVTIRCGGTDHCSRPLKHSKWVEHSSQAAMILKFDFPTMNSNSEFQSE